MNTHTLIIGGTSGMGRNLVETLSGKQQVLSIIGQCPASRTKADDADTHYWDADVSDKKSLLTALDEIINKNGKLDNLIFFQRYRGEKNEWDGEIETSLTATKNIIEYLAEEFKGNGSIVVVSSTASEFIVDEQPLVYHVAKAGLNQMVRYYAVNLGAKGIRVNSVSPGIVLKEESKEFYEKNKDIHDFYCGITPLGKMCVSEEVSNLIEYLCGLKSSFITGQNIVIDGGISLRWQGSLARRIENKEEKRNG